jgi:hypothetical protein
MGFTPGMSALTIELPDQVLTLLKHQAKQTGRAVEEMAKQVLCALVKVKPDEVTSESAAPPQKPWGEWTVEERRAEMQRIMKPLDLGVPLKPYDRSEVWDEIYSRDCD